MNNGNLWGVAFVLLVAISLFGCAYTQIHSGEYIGVNYEDANTSYGAPTNEFEITFSEKEMLHEYQNNLYTVLSGEDGVKLLEVWWETEYETLIVWFREKDSELIAIDSLRYGKYVSF